MGPIYPLIVAMFLGSNSDFLHDLLFQDEWKELKEPVECLWLFKVSRQQLYILALVNLLIV